MGELLPALLSATVRPIKPDPRPEPSPRLARTLAVRNECYAGLTKQVRKPSYGLFVSSVMPPLHLDQSTGDLWTSALLIELHPSAAERRAEIHTTRKLALACYGL
jgi:hypothetical protein